MQDHIRDAIFTLIIIYIFGSIVIYIYSLSIIRKFIIKRKIKCQGFFISVIYTIAIPYRNLLIIFQLVVIGCLLMCSVICRPMAWLIFRGRPVPGCRSAFPVSLCRLSHLLTVFSEQPSCSAIWLTDLPAIDKWIMEPRCAMVRFLNGPVRSMVTSNEAYFAPVKFMTEFMGFHHNALSSVTYPARSIHRTGHRYHHPLFIFGKIADGRNFFKWSRPYIKLPSPRKT